MTPQKSAEVYLWKIAKESSYKESNFSTTSRDYISSLPVCQERKFVVVELQQVGAPTKNWTWFYTLPMYCNAIILWELGGVNGNRTRTAAGLCAVYQIPHGGLSENRTLLVRVRAGYFAIKVYKPWLVPTVRFELTKTRFWIQYVYQLHHEGMAPSC